MFFDLGLGSARGSDKEATECGNGHADNFLPKSIYMAQGRTCSLLVVFDRQLVTASGVYTFMSNIYPAGGVCPSLTTLKMLKQSSLVSGAFWGLNSRQYCHSTCCHSTRWEWSPYSCGETRGAGQGLLGIPAERFEEPKGRAKLFFCFISGFWNPLCPPVSPRNLSMR